jgi:hypothetical protein
MLYPLSYEGGRVGRDRWEKPGASSLRIGERAPLQPEFHGGIPRSGPSTT